MNRKVVFGFVFFIIIITLVFYFQSGINESKHLDSMSTTSVRPSSDQNNTVQALKLHDVSYSSCTKLNTSIHIATSQFRKTIDQRWDKYLEKNYSLDQITVAIDFVTGSRAAYQFRKGMLVLETPYYKALKDKRDLYHQQYGKDFKDHIDFNIELPQAKLKNFNLLNSHEKKTLLSSITITADDIAYFIASQSTLDSDILLMLQSLSHYDHRIGYQSTGPLYLIDFATKYQRTEVVNFLLDNGASVSNDPYLKNTLEYAIEALRKRPENEALAQVVKKLISLGLPINLQETNEQYFVYQLNTTLNTLFIDKNTVQIFLEKHSIDLQEIPSKTKLSNKESNNLLKNIFEQQKNKFFIEYFNEPNIVLYLQQCKNYLSEFNEQLTIVPYLIIKEEIASLYNHDTHAITSELSNIDPSLAHCYTRISSYSTIEQIPFNQESNKMWAYANNKEYAKAIEQANRLDLSQKQKNYFFWRMLTNNKDLLSTLRNNNYFPEKLSYRQLFQHLPDINPDIIEQLFNIGVDTYYADINQISLMSYATYYNKTELLSYLIEKGYPYKHPNALQDPLHIALNTQSLYFRPELTIDIVRRLKPHTREIDQYHLSRMLVIKLKYQDIYQQLIDLYPVLTVNEDTQLPLSLCEVL